MTPADEIAFGLEVARRCWGHELPRPLNREDQRIADLVDRCERMSAQAPQPNTQGNPYLARYGATGTSTATDAPLSPDGPQSGAQASNVVQLDSRRRPKP